jgi:diguanylate cyclase (GGDEF)-like protein
VISRLTRIAEAGGLVLPFRAGTRPDVPAPARGGRLDRRERRAETVVAAAFLAAGGAMLLAFSGDGRPLDPGTAAVLVAAYALVMRVRFQIGAGYAVPTQIVLVPMLFLLPAQAVPLAVAAGSIAGALPGVLAGHTHPHRLIVALANGAFAIGPALVFALSGPGMVGLAVCVAAFVAQEATDFAASALREWLCSDVPPSFQARVMGLVAMVDALLWPVGLLAAKAAQRNPWDLVLVLPLSGLLALMARDRNARLEQVRRQATRLERAAQRMGEAFASRLDREATLALILDAAIDVANADCGRVTERVAGQGPRVLATSPGSSAAARVLRAAEDGVRPGRPLPAGATAVAIPLWTGESGGKERVVSLSVSRAERPFSAAECQLLADLGAQAAVSVENVARHERLARQAATDELTGLLNHRRFHEVLKQETTGASRFRTPPALVLLDIDDFKQVNDTHGHQWGDRVLSAVARAVESGARSGDHVARYGGEEFAVVLPHADLAQAHGVAERIRSRIASIELEGPDGRAIRPTASVGVAVLEPASADKHELIAAADAALYEGKRRGKNQTVCAADLGSFVAPAAAR